MNSPDRRLTVSSLPWGPPGEEAGPAPPTSCCLPCSSAMGGGGRGGGVVAATAVDIPCLQYVMQLKQYKIIPEDSLIGQWPAIMVTAVIN